MREAVQHRETYASELWKRDTRLVLWALVLVGAAAFLLGALGSQPGRAWQTYLVNYLFWSGLAVNGAVMTAIWRATNSRWGRRLSGAALATLGFLPVALLAFLPLIIGRAHIFPWLGHPKPNRAVWLDPTFLFTRNLLSLVLLYAFSAAYAYFLLRPAAGSSAAFPLVPPGTSGASALAQLRGLRAWLVRDWRGADAEAARAQQALRWMTPVLLILYALVLSLVAFDFVMSLDPQFVSTLFGGYYFVTNLYAGWALLAVLLAVWLAREPRLGEVIGSDELHQLGKLIFGFCMLYGMVFWSQYLVIWYGNLLEEIPYLILRQNTAPWSAVSYTMIFMSLLVPFCILLSQPVKKNPRALAGVGLLVLTGMWLERYLLVVPSLWPGVTGHAGASAAGTAGTAYAAASIPASAAGSLAPTAAAAALPLGLLELAVTAGFAAAFLLCYAAFARAFPITLSAPTGRPRSH